MKVIDDYLQSMQDMYGPTVRHVGVSAAAYAERICYTLDCIHNAITPREDERFQTNIMIPVTPTKIEVGTVPAGAIWELEVITGFSPEFGAVLYADSRLRWRGLQPPPPVRFIGPCTVSIAQDAATVSEAFIQFRVIQRKPMAAKFVGRVERGIEPIAAERVHSPLHSGIGIE